MIKNIIDILICSSYFRDIKTIPNKKHPGMNTSKKIIKKTP